MNKLEAEIFHLCETRGFTLTPLIEYTSGTTHHHTIALVNEELDSIYLLDLQLNTFTPCNDINALDSVLLDIDNGNEVVINKDYEGVIWSSLDSLELEIEFYYTLTN